MSLPDHTTGRPRGGAARFRTTRWSVIHAAAGSDSTAAREALAVLCETYWYPVYAFVRRAGSDAEEARDLTQGFFARLLEKRDIATADPTRGRFRNFLLASVRHFVSNQRDREQAAKRGGGQTTLSIDFRDAEGRFALEPVETSTPETIFLRQWALTVVERALRGLGAEYGRQGKATLFDRLRPLLVGGGGGADRRELAAGLGLSETALNVTLHRMRRRLRRKLKEEVGQTLVDPAEADDELRDLMAALSD